MRFHIQTPLLVGLSIFLLGGCCSGPKCWETRSGKDWPRARAPSVKFFNRVINDSVSSPKKDRTDWRYVIIKRKGTLKVHLHWDKGKSRLQLTIFDNMGVKLMDGRVWGTGGRQAVVAVEQPGRYYIRVRAQGEDDESHYALRLSFKGQKLEVCHGCERGAKRCVGEEHYIVCEQKSPGCTIWPTVHSCAEGDCSTLSCGKATPPPVKPVVRRTGCRAGARRCIGKHRFVTCVKKGTKKKWGRPTTCPGGQSCARGACKVAERKVQKPKGCVNGRIISMYKYRGRMNLHIKIGPDTGIRSGHTGHIIEGTSNKPLAGGTIRVTRVTGEYCIATTKVERLGKNRKVCIKPR